MYAIRGGNKEVVEILAPLEKSIRNNSGESALDIAKRMQLSQEIIDILSK